MNKIDNNIEKIYALTPFQQGILSDALMDHAGDYILQTELICHQRIDEDLLKRAVQILMDEEQVLRTNIVHRKVKQPFQVVYKERRAELNIYSEELDAGLVWERDRNRGFQLDKDRLFRTSLWSDADGQHLLFTFHHIIMDGWSMGLFKDRFIEVYTSLNNKQTPKKLNRTLNLSDVVREIEGQRSVISQEYWREALAEGQSFFQAGIPEDAQDHRQWTYDFPAHLNDKISGFLKETGLTLNTFCESVFGFVLSCLSNTEKIVYSKVVSGREGSHKDLDRLVGPLTRTIPAVQTFPLDENWLEIMRKNQGEWTKAMSLRPLPLHEINQLHEDLNNFHKVLYVFENYPSQDTPTDLFEVKAESEKTPHPLHVGLYEEDGLHAGISHLADVISEERVRAMLDLMAETMDRIIENPAMTLENTPRAREEWIQRQVKGLPLVEAGQAHLLDRMEEVINRHGEKIALSDGEAQITYATLKKRVEELSFGLRDKVNSSKPRVAIHLERGTDIVECILAVINLGGIYIPIEPGLPLERKQFMVEDSGAQLVISQDELPGLTCPQASLQELDSEGHLALSARRDPKDPLYIIYTSGSTGLPKGVLVPEEGVVKLVDFFIDRFRLTPADVVLHFANDGFDVAVLEIFMALLAGSCLSIAKKDVIADPRDLHDFMAKEAVTLCYMPPDYSDLMNFQGLTTLRLLFNAGSAAKADFIRKLPLSIEYFNLYGPTETTVISLLWSRNDPGAKDSSVPIGRPVPYQGALILQGKQIAEEGAPGELCITGNGLALGYLNRPEVTEKAFFKNPYAEGRIYRTGDLAVKNDEIVDYLGRIDRQVKVRGYRIELGEIETRARELIDEIREVVVASQGSALALYYVSDSPLDEGRCKQVLKESLPDYMVPTSWLRLTEIPRTASGKVNYHALPKLEKNIKKQNPPQNELEQAVADCFSKVLGLAVTDRSESFFSLGGHSLTAIRLSGELEKVFDRAVPLKSIFKAPSVEAMAKVIEEPEGRKEEIKHLEDSSLLEMSSTQKRMFLLEETLSLQAAYHIPEKYYLNADISEGDLRQALEQMVKRHPALRTVFYVQGDKFIQEVLKDVALDFVSLPEGDPTEQWEELLKPFDLTKGPLFRARLLPGELWLNFHHIIFDGESSDIFQKELEDLLLGRSLPQLELTYGDYSAWMEQRNFSDAEKFYAKLFENQPEAFELPLDHPRPAQPTFKGDVIHGALPHGLTRSLEDFASKLEMTEFMVLSYAFAATLSRFGNCKELTLGTPVAGRKHPDLSGLLGLFVNTIALPFKVDPAKTFRHNLLLQKPGMEEVLDHSDYPFERLISLLNANGEMEGNPLFQVMVGFNQVKPSEHGLLTYNQAMDQRTAKFDITLNFFRDQEISWELEFKSDLWKPATMERIMASFRHFLEEWLADPDQSLQNVGPLDQDLCLMENWNESTSGFMPQGSLLDSLQQIFRAHPNEVALIDQDEKITYRELETAGLALAAHLQSEGVGYGEFVGLYFNSGSQAVIAMLGVLFAGAAYVPLDPKNPSSRLSQIIKESGLKIILHGATKLPEEIQGVVSWDVNATTNGVYEPLTRGAKNIAYLMYTSGSTGIPKGVMVEDQAILRLVWGLPEEIRKGSCTVLQAGSLAFDAATFEIFTPLLMGGTIVMARELTPDRLSQTLVSQGVDTMWMTAALFNQFMDEAPESFRGLKHLLIGGQKLSEAHVEKFLSHHKECSLYNGYGPTEATTFTTIHPIKAMEYPLPIGKPIGNTRIEIRQGIWRCGVGMVGELCIGGPGLARGYYKQLDLTRERFFVTEEGHRLYRSGDLARFRPDGVLEFFGRMDQQVKLRGYRIELGEINAAIRNLPGITEAYTILVGEADQAHLASYYVGDRKEADLISRLEDLLPSYMVPSFAMRLERLPLTVNGKVSQADLPQIEIKSTDQTGLETEAERAVALAFQEILNIDNPGRCDDFFRLGGDSINAIRIVSHLRNQGWSGQVKDILSQRSPARIGRKLKPGVIRQYDQSALQGEVAKSPIMEAFLNLWNFPRPNHFNQSMALALDEPLTHDRVTSLMDRLTDHHDVLRGHIRDGQFRIRPAGSSYFKYGEISGQEEDLVEQEATKWQAGLDISDNLIAVLQVTVKDKHWLFIIIHHLLVDGVSWQILLEDIQRLLNDEELPDKTASFSLWLETMAELANKKTAEKAYWQAAVESTEAVLVEPDQEEKEIILSEEQTSELMETCHRAYGTKMDDLLLAALVRALGRNTTIAMESHGRTDEVDVTRTVGWFTSLYPVSLDYRASLEDLILSTKEALRKVPRLGIGFGWLYPERLPQCEINFNYLGDVTSGDNHIRMGWGEEIFPGNKFHYPVEFNAYCERGQLKISLLQGRGSQLDEAFKQALQEIIDVTSGKEQIVQSKSDIEVKGIEDQDLDQLNDLLCELI